MNNNKEISIQNLTTPRRFKRKSKPSFFARAFKFTLWVFLCLIAVGIGSGYSYLKKANPFVSKIVHQIPELIIGTDPTNHFHSDRVNILILGVDQNYDDRGRPVEGFSRSDSIMLMQCDFRNGEEKIQAISIPRDTEVRIPRHGVQKINAAHAFGGPDLAKETIESVLGVSIDEVVTLDFRGFQKLIDFIGGIEVDVPKKMDYDDNWGNLHIHLKPGLQRLNGYQTMGFVRFRHSDDDLQRISRQQMFLQAFKTQLSQQPLRKYPEILQKIRDSVGGTIRDDSTLISLAGWLRNLDSQKIRLETLPVIVRKDGGLNIDERKADELIELLNFRVNFANNNAKKDSFNSNRQENIR